MLARSAARALSAPTAARLFHASASARTKVAVLGAGGGIGQPLSLLLKNDPLVTSLSLYDIRGAPGVAADVSHVDTASEVRVFHALNLNVLRSGKEILNVFTVSRSKDTPLTSSTKLSRVLRLLSSLLVFPVRYSHSLLRPAKTKANFDFIARCKSSIFLPFMFSN